jgi:hypothetical protein
MIDQLVRVLSFFKAGERREGDGRPDDISIDRLLTRP